MSNPFLPFAAAVLAATCAGAQIAPLASSSGIHVMAGGVSTAILPGNDISTGFHLGANAGTAAATVDLGVEVTTAAIGQHFTFGCSATTQTQTAGAAATRHELYSARAITGRFVITWALATTGTGAALFAFDLGGDGTVEATAAAVVPANLAPGLNVFTIDLQCSSYAGVIQGPWGMQWPYAGTVSGALSIRFEATHAIATPFGAACGVGSWSVAANFLGGVDLASPLPPAVDLAIAALGFDQLAVPPPLPLAPGCALLLTPQAVAWHVPTNGVARWSIGLPVGIGPVAFAAQVVALDIETTQALTGAGVWIVTQ